MWLKTLTIFLLMTPCLWGQLTVSSRSAIQLSGIDESEKIGSAVFVSSDSTVARLPVILITATTEAANITFEVSDKDRNPVNFERLTPNTIMVSQQGKSWVRIVVIDFEKNLYDTKLFQISLNTPEPDPDIPTPPDGPFDSLAKRVAKVSVLISVSDRNKLISLLTSAVDKMVRYDFHTLEEAREYIESGWIDVKTSKQLNDLLTTDSFDRLLSWKQAQAYYLEIVKGLK